MSIINKFLGKKEQQPAAPESKEVKKKEIAPKMKKEVAPKETAKSPEKKAAPKKKVAKKEGNLGYKFLLEPIISEKSTGLGQLNMYVFKVKPDANKHQIKQAIEGYYGVNVLEVNTIKIHRKKRVQGKTVGWKKGYKKAVVKLAQGETIALAEGV
ncbi:MAG: 50S ribosomal protein L23 [Parcubacteria group bacterium]|jgi:large subunit ribosomal protein L23